MLPPIKIPSTRSNSISREKHQIFDFFFCSKQRVKKSKILSNFINSATEATVEMLPGYIQSLEVTWVTWQLLQPKNILKTRTISPIMKISLEFLWLRGSSFGRVIVPLVWRLVNAIQVLAHFSRRIMQYGKQGQPSYGTKSWRPELGFPVLFALTVLLSNHYKWNNNDKGKKQKRHTGENLVDHTQNRIPHDRKTIKVENLYQGTFLSFQLRFVIAIFLVEMTVPKSVSRGSGSLSDNCSFTFLYDNNKKLLNF